MNPQTTDNQPLTSGPRPEWVVIYAPDGSEHRCTPVDAREILESGNGYTAEPHNGDEQQSIEQPIADDAHGEEAQSEAPTGEEIITEALETVRKRGRGRKN